MSSENDDSSLFSSLTLRSPRACLGITLSHSVAFSSVRLLLTAMYSNSFPNHSNHSNHSAYNSGPRIISLPHPSVQAPSPQVHPQALALPGTFPLPNQQLNGHHSYLCSPLPTSYYQPLQNRTLYTNLVVSNNRLAAGSDPVRPAAVLGPSKQTINATEHA